MNWEDKLPHLHTNIHKPYLYADDYKNVIEQDKASIKAITDFIKTEIIEKLIDDIPDEIEKHMRSYEEPLGYSETFYTDDLKQQLKDKWL